MSVTWCSPVYDRVKPIASGYRHSSGMNRLRTRVKKNDTAHSENAKCSDGIAATGLEPSWAWFMMLPAPCRPIAVQPRDEMRATGSISPYLAAHHGGAAGHSM